MQDDDGVVVGGLKFPIVFRYIKVRAVPTFSRTDTWNSSGIELISADVHVCFCTNKVDDLIARDPPLVIPDPVQGVERVHFYLVYRGGNHRGTQEKIARCSQLFQSRVYPAHSNFFHL